MESSSTLVLGCSVALLGVVLGVRWALMPRPYEGIPYNKASARRINGDISEVAKNYKKTNEFSRSLFNVSTSVQGTPVAQVLFPNFRRPLIMIDDPREVEDILVRRHAEFDRAPMVTNLFIPFWPEASLSQRTTPKLRAQKRVWADVMNPAFLRKVAAPNIHKATLELLNLWRLKTIANDGQAFRVADDFLNAELDVIWVAIVGEEPGITRYKLEQLRCEYAGKKQNQTQEEIERQQKSIPIPAGLFLRDEIGYVEGVIARNALAPIPKLAQQIETWKPRFRKFKSSISSGITTAMIKSIERFQRLETGSLETDDEDTCMMDLVLRRKIVESRKTGKPLKDPTQDQEMLDEMFIMLTGGHDSTANTLSWFVRFMTVNPSIQKELREILRQHFPGTGTPSAHEILDADIPFLDAVCHETLRVAGTARATSRIVTQDTEILGYPIPKDSTIFLNLHITESPFEVSESVRTSSSQAAAEKHQYDFNGPAGANIAKFEPRRWLVKDETTGREKFNSSALPLLAFGGGFRGCPGHKFAPMSIRIIFVILVLNLDFLDLPEEFSGTGTIETIFSLPDTPYARVKVL